MSKTLIIYHADEFIANILKKRGILIYKPYNLKFWVNKFLFRISHNKPYFLSLLYPWKKHIKEVDLIIVFARKDKLPLLKYINRKDNSKRIILWYWNPVEVSLNPDSVPNSLCEKWSFDKNDCEKYNLSYNTQFYFNDIKLPQLDIIHDIYFVGLEKDRRQYIEELKRQFEDFSLSCKFDIVSKKRTIKDKLFGISYLIPYSTVLKNIAQSKAILDIIQENQAGLTLRPFEALFLRKKLITNYKQIIEEDFYHPDNIFVIGIDEISLLPAFLKVPFHDLPEVILRKYDFSAWLSRFSITNMSGF